MKRFAALGIVVAAVVGSAVQAHDAASAARARPSAKVRKATTTSTTVPVPAFDAATVANVRADGDWLLQAQMADGAIGHYVDRVKIWPYLANEAALGLARATEVTKDPKYLAATWKWLAWYQAHMDASGFVTDYDVVGGVPRSTGDMDSTDAYAGTFLLAARKAWKVSGDTTTLGSLRSGITKAVAAVESTQDVDGMTWAKPSWKVKYLMDQSETYGGLRAAVDLATALHDPVLAQRAKSDADRMAAGVASMWNAPTGAYDWAKHSSGARQTTDWKLLYSDSLQQAWAVTYGMSAGAPAADLLNRFVTAQPSWANPAAVARFTAGPTVVGYWPQAGLGFLQTGQPAKAAASAASIRTAAVAAGKAWPFDTGVAGMLVLLESGDTNYIAR